MSSRLLTLIKEVAKEHNYGFLFESKKLKGSGKDAERHANKYVAPLAVSPRSNPVDAKSNISLNSEIRNDKGKVVGNPGSKLVPIQGTTREIAGKLHTDFHVVHPDGTHTKATIPHTSVSVESEKTGKHNEEHAVIRAWNHFSDHFDGKTPSLKDMHDEISAAQKDKTHPLHISKVPKSEFVHGLNGHGDEGSNAVKERAEHSYYGNMRDAAHTVAELASHKDFKTHWKNGDTLEHSGKMKPELSQHYKGHGVRGTGATSKGDALIMKSSKDKTKGIKALSFKKTGGSQLMSSSPAEFHAIYHHALKQSGDDNEANLGKLQRARNHIEKGEHEKANKIVQGMHNSMPHLIHHVAHEALTGNGKFASAEGRATHVASIGKDAHVWTTNEFMHEHHDAIAKARPRVRASKHGGVQSTVSLETPRIPKRKVNASLVKEIYQKIIMENLNGR